MHCLIFTVMVTLMLKINLISFKLIFMGYFFNYEKQQDDIHTWAGFNW